MIQLHQPPPAWGLPSISPFCVKLETYLRMAQVPYRVAPGNPMQAPKGKIPYVQLDGKLLGDSELIIDALKKKFGDPLDSKLTADQKAQSLVVQRMVEEHLYFASAWLRWNTDESWSHVRAYFLNLLPPVFGKLIVKKIRSNFMKNLKGQGMGRHSREEILDFAKKDLSALSQLLGNRSFFFGDEPASIDATLYGFLVQILWVPWESELKTFAKSLPNLESYCHRMKKKFWS